MKGLLLALVVLGLLLVAADRIGVGIAERAVADRLVQHAGLTSPPSVDIRGTPFLTQALRGRYEEIVVSAADVPAGEVRLAQLDATLTGVQLPLSDVVSGDVSAVPVDALRATVVLPYGELARRTGAAGVTVQPVGDRLRITGQVEVLGKTLSATADSTVELRPPEVVVTAQSFDVGSGVVNGVLTRTLRGVFDYRLRVEGLPYGLVPSGLDVTERGLVLDAFAVETVLTR